MQNFCASNVPVVIGIRDPSNLKYDASAVYRTRIQNHVKH